MYRTVFCVVLIVVAGALLSGCAAQSSALAKHSGTDLYDAAYINAVEHKAAQRGIKVRWIAPPLKAVAVASSESGNE